MSMIDAANKLLDDFADLPADVERPATFMEIAGYPHYENACSNILAFFMDPAEAHGLRTLVLDALLSTGRDTKPTVTIDGDVAVEREVSTDKGRIDVLITSDDHAVLVENKIHASASNPFDDYAAYLDRVANGRAEHKFLLTLYPTNEGRAWGFTNLTHEEFVGRIRSLLGLYVSSADTRYLTIFLDFLNTLENLRKGTRMNEELVRLLAERTNEVRDFLTKVHGFKDELRKKVRELGEVVDVEKYQNVRQFFWREREGLYDILVHDVTIHEGLLVAIEADISPDGWGIYLWPRRGDRSELSDLLQRAMVPVDGEDGEGFSHPARFGYDENLDQIRPVLQDLVDKLATGQERAE